MLVVFVVVLVFVIVVVVTVVVLVVAAVCCCSCCSGVHTDPDILEVLNMFIDDVYHSGHKFGAISVLLWMLSCFQP